jgi:CDGSH-type Zn-finger protein
LTDIISFDYSIGNELHWDVFISVERVIENAQDFKVTFEEEKEVWLCQCKKTKTPPFCDGSHK